MSRLLRFWPALLPLLIAALWWSTGHPARMVASAALALVLFLALLAGVDLRKALTALVHAIGAVAAAAIFLVTVIPAWAIARVRRRDVLRGKEPAPSWRITSTDRTPDSLGATGGTGRASRTIAGRLTWAVGAVVVVLVLNFAMGWTWDAAVDLRDRTPATAVAGTGSTPSTSAPPRSASSAVTTTTLPRDPRNDSPAMAAYAWRERYFMDLQRTPGTYWPFTESRPLSFQSPYVNIDDWNRRSYEPSSHHPMPSIWVFGGSTTFGEGQRDQYTIPSWIARLAEQAGTPIRVRNYGQRGWTHFQEMLLYEQQMAAEDPPDIAVFYDGANELNAQSLMTESVPTHTTALQLAQRLSGLNIVTRVVDPAPPPRMSRVWHDVRVAYAEHSLVHKVAHWLGLSADPAAADESSEQDPNRGFNTNQNTDPSGLVWTYDVALQDAKDAIDVYERGRDLTLHLSDEHGVEPVFFWQPRGYVGPPEAWANDHLTPPTIDITHALDQHQDTYIDGGHTNEEGARIVAEAIWANLRASVDRWYDEHD